MADINGQAELPPASVPLEERMERAELWQAGADERERLADEREALANERDALADERDRMADRQEHSQDRREAEQGVQGAEVEETAEGAAALAALRRAEAAVRRAEAELERTRQAASRIRATVARRVAAAERATTARSIGETVDTEERAWLADRRDFVAAERDHLADERDTTADRREETAGLRERVADARERELLERERRFDRRRTAGSRDGAARNGAGHGPAADSEIREDGQRRRERAAADRRAAAQDRARAAAAWGPQPYGPMLLASFAPVARQFFGNNDLREVLAQVLTFTVDAVAGCDCASIALFRHGRIVDAVASDAVAAELDDVQFATGIGPGPEALQSEGCVYAPDLANSPRWPVLAATAAQLEVASAVSLGLSVHRPAQWSALGAFNLYSATPGAFSDDDQEFVSILAAYVAVAVAIDERREEVDRREAALHRGLSSRDVIGQAKGILMERQHLSAGDAFDLLRRVSQRLNRKLTDVAQHLAETGEIPT